MLLKNSKKIKVQPLGQHYYSLLVSQYSSYGCGYDLVRLSTKNWFSSSLASNKFLFSSPRAPFYNISSVLKLKNTIIRYVSVWSISFFYQNVYRRQFSWIQGYSQRMRLQRCLYRVFLFLTVLVSWNLTLVIQIVQ